jgi:putative ABC transport system substrate-binding protein
MELGAAQRLEKSMRRRFVGFTLSPLLFAPTTVGALLLALCVAAEAQQSGKVYRVGYLSAQSPMGLAEDALLHGLRDFGYVEGRNITVERRFAEGKLDRLPGLAEELVRVKVDVLVTSSIQSTLAAKSATKTLPIVFAIADNPVESGVVASLARPGGNATGITDFADELSGKRVELLKEAVPKVSRLAVLVWKPDGPGNADERKEIESAARLFGIEVQPVEIRKPEELDSGFLRIAKAGANAFMGLTDTRFSFNQGRIIELSVKNRLPCVYPNRQFVEAGGLMSYGTNRAEWRKRVGFYVDKILKGSNPADLPVEQPRNFEFIVNLKAANLSRSG